MAKRIIAAGRLVRIKYVCGCVIFVTPDLAASPPPHYPDFCPQRKGK